MKMTVWNRFILGSILTLSLPACVSVNMERGYPARRYFVLALSGTPMGAPGNPSGVLKLHRVRVSPPYDGKGFVYRLGPQVFETDFYHQFLAAPGAMIGEELLESLQRSELYQYVVNSASPVESTHQLEATVDALYGDFTEEGTGQAVVRMSFVMSRDAAQNPGVVFQKSYEKTMRLQERSPEALVQGWNRALGEIVSMLIHDLRPAK